VRAPHAGFDSGQGRAVCLRALATSPEGGRIVLRWAPTRGPVSDAPRPSL